MLGVHMSVGDHGGQKRTLNFLELEIGGYEPHTDARNQTLSHTTIADLLAQLSSHVFLMSKLYSDC